MEKVPAKVISGGRITLPKELRREMQIEEGDYVVVSAHPMEDTDE